MIRDHVVGVQEAPPSSLNLYMRVPCTRALGPFLRYGLWVQGCPLRCPACMTPDAWPFDGGTAVPVDTLVEEILGVDDIEGLTVSGGEPFAQAPGIASLIQRLRERRDLGLIVYTGFRLAELRRRARSAPGIAALLAATDILIDGPFVASRNDGVALRGSANQQVWPLTERYRQQLGCYAEDRPRAIELHVSIDDHKLIGIPTARQLEWWQRRKPPAAGDTEDSGCR